MSTLRQLRSNLMLVLLVVPALFVGIVTIGHVVLGSEAQDEADRECIERAKRDHERCLHDTRDDTPLLKSSLRLRACEEIYRHDVEVCEEQGR